MIYTVSPLKRRILIALRDAHGEHLTTPEISELVGEPIYHIRWELRDLRSWRLIHQDREFGWELTAPGVRVSFGDQLELGI